MKKIGFIDNFLSEWHANNYPEMLKNNVRAQALGLQVCYAYAKTEVSPYDGVSTDEWCAKYGVERLNSIEELVDKSDLIVVFSPDNPELHEELSEYALKSGKPVYIDKTFATSKASAEKMFALAKANGTPMYSSSALRFADEYKDIRLGDVGAKNAVLTGPFFFEIYAIHIFEMMCTVMKDGAKRMMAVQNGKNRTIVVDYGEGRTAVFNQNETGNAPFTVSIEMPDGQTRYATVESSYFENFIDALVTFFETGMPQVDSAETIDLMGMLDSARKALLSPFTWVEL